MIKKIFIEDAEKYVELLNTEKELEDYLKTIYWCKRNIEQVNFITLAIDREPQATDEGWQSEIYLTELKELIIDKVYDALHEKLAEVQNDREDLIDYCNNEVLEC